MKRETLVKTGDRMVAYVRKVNAHDPGTRAALRRGLGRPPEDIANFHAHAVVALYLPEEHDRATERAFYTVAALVAAQQRGARDQEAEEWAQDEDADTEVVEEQSEGRGRVADLLVRILADDPGQELYRRDDLRLVPPEETGRR